MAADVWFQAEGITRGGRLLSHLCDNNNNNGLDEQTFSSEPYHFEPQARRTHTDPGAGEEERLVISEWYKPCAVLHYNVYKCHSDKYPKIRVTAQIAVQYLQCLE